MRFYPNSGGTVTKVHVLAGGQGFPPSPKASDGQGGRGLDDPRPLGPELRDLDSDQDLLLQRQTSLPLDYPALNSLK